MDERLSDEELAIIADPYDLSAELLLVILQLLTHPIIEGEVPKIPPMPPTYKTLT